MYHGKIWTDLENDQTSAMTGPNHQYEFTKLTETDLPLIRSWLEKPHVRKWWGDPDHEFELVKESIGHHDLAMWLVFYDGTAFAFIQDYDIDEWPQEALSHLPSKTRGIDIFIGNETMLSKGHGSNAVRIKAERLIEQGAPLVIIDPDPNNIAAIRAYARAGFKGNDIIQTDEGPAVLMIFEGKS